MSSEDPTEERFTAGTHGLYSLTRTPGTHNVTSHKMYVGRGKEVFRALFADSEYVWTQGLAIKKDSTEHH